MADPSSRRPIIGIIIPVEEAKFRGWEAPAHLLMRQYADQVRNGGGIPVLSPVGGDEAEADQFVSMIDGLILAGGVDVNPATYGAQPHEASGPYNDERDAWEMTLFNAAGEADVPVLAICRGMQVVNVARGGTLDQHLPDTLGHTGHAPTPGEFVQHPVKIAEGSQLHAAVGESRSVPAYHHQSVATVGKDLTPVAWAEDGVVEGLEDPDGSVLAVQWHPEMADDADIFTEFVRRCDRS